MTTQAAQAPTLVLCGFVHPSHTLRTMWEAWRKDHNATGHLGKIFSWPESLSDQQMSLACRRNRADGSRLLQSLAEASSAR